MSRGVSLVGSRLPTSHLPRPPPTAPADMPPVEARRQTAQNVSQMSTHPDFANYVGVEQPSGEIELGVLDHVAANDPLRVVEAGEDLVAQRAKLRRMLQKHTNLTPKQIDKILKGVDKDVNSITKAIESKYGKGDIPTELPREIVDCVKSYIKNVEEIAKGFKDFLSASAAR